MDRWQGKWANPTANTRSISGRPASRVSCAMLELEVDSGELGKGDDDGGEDGDDNGGKDEVVLFQDATRWIDGRKTWPKLQAPLVWVCLIQVVNRISQRGLMRWWFLLPMHTR